MTTLIAVYDSDGCKGRCDARCYDATSEICDCVCGGKNHGVGINRAAENTRQLAEQMLSDYFAKQNLDPSSVRSEVLEKPIQLTLF